MAKKYAADAAMKSPSGETNKSTRGGARPGSGRKPGSKNAKTLEFEAFCREALQKAQPKEGDLSAKEFFQSIYRDDRLPYSIRSHAAEKVLPYESPRLATTELTGPGGGPIETRLTDARSEVQRKLARLQPQAA